MSLGDLGAGAGTDVGVAKGRIEVDLTQFRQAHQQMLQISRQMESAILKMGTAADASIPRQISSWTRVTTAIEGMVGPLAMASGLIMGIGTRAANQIKRSEIAFRALSGGVEQANRNMAQLEELSGRIGVNMLDLQSAAVALIPASRRANVELKDMVLLAQRLISIAPYKSYEDAARALSELLAGQYVSIVNQFNLSRTAIHEIINAAKGDTDALLEGLSEYLDGIGATEDALVEMGRSGVNAGRNMRQEWRLTLGQAFQPVATVLNQIQGLFAQVAVALRPTNAELTQTVALMMALVSTGSGLAGLKSLPFIGQALPISPRLAAGATRAGVYGAAAYGGAMLGTEIVQWAGRQRGDEHMANYGLSDAWKTIKQLAVMLVWAIAELSKIFLKLIDGIQEIFLDLLNNLGITTDHIRAALVAIVEAFWDGAYWVSEQLSKIGIHLNVPKRPEETRGTNIQTFANALRVMLQTFLVRRAQATGKPITGEQWAATIEGPQRLFRAISGAMQFLKGESESAADSLRDTGDWVDRASTNLDNMVVGVAKAFGLLEEDIRVSWADRIRGALRGAIGTVVSAMSGDTRLFGITDEQLDAFAQFQEDLAEIERQGQERRVALEEAYQLSLTREMEDEQVRRRRALEDLANAIADIQQGLAETIAEATTEYNERVSEINAEFQKAEAQRLRDHQRDMERMEREHRRNLLDAASRLDAIAVWQEMQRYTEQRRTAEESFDEETRQRQEQLQERLEQERKAHEDRLAEARKAAEQRIQDMREDFAQQERLYAEDRARRLARMAEDHANQLRELNKSIADQRTARTKQYINELSAANQHAARMVGIASKEYDALYREFVAFLAKMKAAQVASNLTSAIGAATDFLTGRQMGGEIYATGPRMTEAGEFVLRSDTANTMRRALGAPLTQGKVLETLYAAQSSKGGTTVQVGDIIIQGGRGDPRQIARMVREELAMIIG